MPRTDGQPDSIGVRYEGNVVTGRTSLQLAFDRKAHEALNMMHQEPPVCTRPLDYDPVLRNHLHSATPEPDYRSPFTGWFRVGERWMTRQEFRNRHPGP
jgi:hypothetical protein